MKRKAKLRRPLLVAVLKLRFHATSKETVIKGYVNDGTEKGKAVTRDAVNMHNFTQLLAHIQPDAPVAVWVQARVVLNAAQIGIWLVVDEQHGMIFLPEPVRLRICWTYFLIFQLSVNNLLLQVSLCMYLQAGWLRGQVFRLRVSV